MPNERECPTQSACMYCPFFYPTWVRGIRCRLPLILYGIPTSQQKRVYNAFKEIDKGNYKEGCYLELEQNIYGYYVAKR